MQSRSALMFLFAIAAVSAGCDNPCVETCTASLECEGADPETDCEQTCADQKKAAEESGCTNEFDNVVDCVAGTDDVCAVTDDTCKDERDAQLVCLVEYCNNFPGDAVCEN